MCLHALPLFFSRNACGGGCVVFIFILCVYAIVCLAVCVCIFRYWTIGFASNRRLYPISFVSSGDVYFARIRHMRISQLLKMVRVREEIVPKTILRGNPSFYKFVKQSREKWVFAIIHHKILIHSSEFSTGRSKSKPFT